MYMDRRLLTQAESGTPGIRVYGWKGPWVSLGRFQAVEDAMRTGVGVPWVKRPTGGAGVLHGHDATVSLSAPLSTLAPHAHLQQSRWVRAVYRRIVSPIIEALNALGVPAVLAESTSVSVDGAKVSDCFARTSPNDVVSSKTREKLCGVALRITSHAVLLQASLPITAPLIPYSKVFSDGIEHSYVNLKPEELRTQIELAWDRLLSHQ